jgi:hypothetical protein
MKVLIHTPVSNRAWILPKFLEALAAQNIPTDIELVYRFDVNDSQDASYSILENFKHATSDQVELINHPWSVLNLPDHRWNTERYSRMILLRNNALAEAKGLGARYLFSIDSDAILDDSHTLAHLIETDVPVIAGVFMATWGNAAATPLPNVWQRGQNEMTDEFLRGISMAPEHVTVGGLGACTLIRRDVWEAGVNYSPVYNLPSDYRGEDRNFCVRAAVAGFELAACAHKRIRHVDREMLQAKAVG